MNYRSIADLNQTIINNLWKIPKDVDLIVGIPRSGMLAANIVALHLNLPLIDLEGFIEGRNLGYGERGKRRDFDKTASNATKALILDDSILGGATINDARKKVSIANPKCSIIYGAIYAAPDAQTKVDIFFEEVLIPRVFEWNMMHGGMLQHSCVDIDGVLCVDPTEDENDDGPKYREFIINAKPLLLPTAPLGWLVTCRLEKYRDLTEQWLARHNVSYQKLYMMDLPNKAARLASGSHGSFKAKIYLSTKARMFIESSQRQAVEIARVSGKPVLSLESNQMLYPSMLSHMPEIAFRAPGKLRASLRRMKRVLRRQVFGFDPATVQRMG